MLQYITFIVTNTEYGNTETQTYLMFTKGLTLILVLSTM